MASCVNYAGRLAGMQTTGEVDFQPIIRTRGKDREKGMYQPGFKQKIFGLGLILASVTLACALPGSEITRSFFAEMLAGEVQQAEMDLLESILRDFTGDHTYDISPVAYEGQLQECKPEFEPGKSIVLNKSSQGDAFGEGSDASITIREGGNSFTYSKVEVQAGDAGVFSQRDPLYCRQTGEGLMECVTLKVDGFSLSVYKDEMDITPCYLLDFRKTAQEGLGVSGDTLQEGLSREDSAGMADDTCNLSQYLETRIEIAERGITESGATRFCNFNQYFKNLHPEFSVYPMVYEHAHDCYHTGNEVSYNWWSPRMIGPGEEVDWSGRHSRLVEPDHHCPGEESFSKVILVALIKNSEECKGLLKNHEYFEQIARPVNLDCIP